MSEPHLIDIAAEVRGETEKAFRLHDGIRTEWVPKSQVGDNGDGTQMTRCTGASQSVSAPAHDSVNHPAHYTAHPSGVECITITEHMNFCRGNVLKYLWRAGAKGDSTSELEDLYKARWYLDREIAKLEGKK